MSIVPVTEATFEEIVLKADKPVILAIGAPWCIDCRRAQPFYQALSSQYEGRMIFAYADSDENPSLKAKLEVQHIPTMVIFRDGKPLESRLVEVKTPGELKAFVDAALL